jgi:DNA polymerase
MSGGGEGREGEREKLRRLVVDLQGFVEYQKEALGIKEIPAAEKKPVEETIVTKKTVEAGGGGASLSEGAQAMQAVRDELGDCRRCKLCDGRTNIVFGSGSVQTDLVFVGEGPGRDEDIQGFPFVGRAGQLLTKIIESIDLTRDTVYIANVIKCRPPGNRNPAPEEVAACKPFLLKQLEIIRPQIICALGTFAAHAMTMSNDPIGKLRGRFHDFNGIKVMPTFHPAYLLRNPHGKRQVWEDMKMIRDELR